MMLVSHGKKFIYLKTAKTAGTSVEIFFEPYCYPPGTYSESHQRDEIVSEFGVVGARGPSVRHCTFYNHMPACEVQAQVGDDVWNSYFKFCVIRNPYDKVVSAFWFALDASERKELADAAFDEVRKAFSEFVTRNASTRPRWPWSGFSRGRFRATRLPLDRHIYLIDETPAVDRFLRFENLAGEVEEVCRTLAIECSDGRLKRYKGNTRARREHFSEYYDSKTEQIVRAIYRWELDHFGYGNHA